MAGIDPHAIACKLRHMDHSLKDDVEKFVQDSGLSEHRAGILLAKNGRLLERLREGRPILTDTVIRIRAALDAERAKRKLPKKAVAK